MCTNTPTTNTYHHNDVIELVSSRWKVGAVTATAGSSWGGGGGGGGGGITGPLWRPGSRRRGIPILVRMPLLVWYPYDCHAYGCQVVLVTISVSQLDTQRAHGAMMASLWRRGDVETSFWRHCDVVFAPCVRWAVIVVPDGLLTALATWPHLFH